MELTLITPINKVSYGRVGVNLLIQLRKLGAKVNLLPIGPIDYEGKEKEHIDWGLENTKALETTAPVIKIWHQHDMSIPDVLTGPKFGFPIFELDTFTEQEKIELGKVQIINCTKWAEEICHKNGLMNTAGIVNLGYDPDIFCPVERPKNELFTVLNVGKWEIRKGHDIIPEIFSLAFSPKDPVSLVMCCTNPFYTQEETESWINYYNKKLQNYNVSFVGRLDTQVQLANLMRQTDCGLFPARAEGWNLDLLEMLACNIPCVYSDYSGHNEFTTYGIKLNRKELAIDGKWFFGQGQWAEITSDDIKLFAHQLKEIYWLWSDNKCDSGQDVSRFIWENSAKQLMEILNDKN